MRRTVQPGCSVCGELVQSPHWCVKRYELAHEYVVKGNERYRAVMLRERLAQTEHTEPREPKQGVVDLAEWGDWTWCREQGFDSLVVDKAAAQRAERVVATLTAEQRAELRKIYVLRCEATRVALRSKRRALGEPQRGRPVKIAAFTSAEMAYLDVVRPKLAPVISLRLDYTGVGST